jgi:DNA-binding response OmpR family regulator
MSKKILIAEDDILLAKTLATSLKEEGYEVFLAHDGLDGLAMAKEHEPDLILCDINMPKMDGISMLKKIRSKDWGKKLKIIMLTNLSDEDKILEALKNSVFTYLVKSDWELEKIIEKIKEEIKD